MNMLIAAIGQMGESDMVCRLKYMFLLSGEVNINCGSTSLHPDSRHESEHALAWSATAVTLLYAVQC